jgi:hypothetical protein
MFHVEHFDAGQASVLRFGPRTVHFFICNRSGVLIFLQKRADTV